MTTLEIKAIIGINPGYNHNNELNFDNIEQEFKEYVQDVVEQTYKMYHMHISFNINRTITIYDEEFGCPRGGEVTYTLSSINNPFFNQDLKQYKAAVKNAIKLIAKYYKQSTVSIIYNECNMTYIRF